jgi:hypothetical protein
MMSFEYQCSLVFCMHTLLLVMDHRFEVVLIHIILNFSHPYIAMQYGRVDVCLIIFFNSHKGKECTSTNIGTSLKSATLIQSSLAILMKFFETLIAYHEKRLDISHYLDVNYLRNKLFCM